MSMVKVRVLQQMSGTRNGEPWPERGETMMVSAEEAAQLGLGQTPIAEVVEDEPVAEPDGTQAPDSPVDAKVQEGETGPANASAAGPVKPKPATAKTTTRPRGASTAK